MWNGSRSEPAGGSSCRHWKRPNKPVIADGSLQRHWAVPLAVHRFGRAGEVNPVLARAFTAMRAADSAAPAGGFYASSDDLLRRIDLIEFRLLLEFLAAALQATAEQANAGVWPGERHDLQLEFLGVWFQMQNGESFHDIHTHGNCSWSGVYYVQIDPLDRRAEHPRHGRLNGATRFYSPLFPLLGGAYMDRGNAWLHNATLDNVPCEGDLVVFPSFLPHKALPYSGDRERIIVSFNAQIRAVAGDRLFGFADV
jgi:uncharacterized protein (TIGR02466 family)